MDLFQYISYSNNTATEEAFSYIHTAIICIQFQGMTPCAIFCPYLLHRKNHWQVLVGKN